MAILDLSNATCIFRKRCKIEAKLLLMTNNSESHMSFRFVRKSVTLNDLERRNGPYLRFFTESLTRALNLLIKSQFL